MLEGEKPNEEALRKQHEALEISIYAREVLNPEKFEQFCRIVVNDTISNKQKFMELHTLVTGKMELQEMLLDILSAGEAKMNQMTHMRSVLLSVKIPENKIPSAK